MEAAKEVVVTDKDGSPKRYGESDLKYDLQSGWVVLDSDGEAWPEGQKCCPDGFECEYQSEYYSQCKVSAHDDDDCANPTSYGGFYCSYGQIALDEGCSPREAQAAGLCLPRCSTRRSTATASR